MVRIATLEKPHRRCHHDWSIPALHRRPVIGIVVGALIVGFRADSPGLVFEYYFIPKGISINTRVLLDDGQVGNDSDDSPDLRPQDCAL